MSSTAELAQRLIRKPSITPNDAGCQDILARALEPSGFTSEFLPFGEVQNLWLRRGSSPPLMVFAGHTDVVPTGPLDEWTHPPFEGKVVDGVLHGRGAADMKGSLAAMVTACCQFVKNHPDHDGSIALLLTSDEEGPAVDGTVRVVQTLKERGEKIDWCLVGEPTSSDNVGDVIKNGRRGSLSGALTVTGIQGHVAYPHLADNPIHRIAAIVDQLAKHVWDQGNAHFPPTTFQVSNLNSGTGATNVVPGQARLDFNFRYAPESTVESLKELVKATCRKHTEVFDIDWSRPNLPFLTDLNIGFWVMTLDPGRQSPTICQYHFNLIGPSHHMMIGNHKAAGIDDEPGPLCAALAGTRSGRGVARAKEAVEKLLELRIPLKTWYRSSISWH